MPKVYTTTYTKSPAKRRAERAEKTRNDELSNSLRQLRTSSEQLNKLSESISQTVRSIEQYLTDECHIGIEVAVPIGDYDGEEYSLAYKKVGNGWRIVLVSDNAFDPNRPWSDCPRGMKLWSAKYLPNLIMGLDAAASNYIKSANETLRTVDAALGELVGGGK